MLTAAPTTGGVWDPLKDPAVPNQDPFGQRAFKTKSGSWVDTKTHMYVPNPNAPSKGPLGGNVDPKAPAWYTTPWIADKQGPPKNGPIPYQYYKPPINGPYYYNNTEPGGGTLTDNNSGTFGVGNLVTPTPPQTSQPAPAKLTSDPTNSGTDPNFGNWVTNQLRDALAANQMTPDIMAALTKTGRANAAAAVNAKVGAATTQKNQYVTEAANRAAAVMAAYRAMANMARGDASNVDNFYRNASQDMASVAKGFTGAMAPAAAAQAARLNATLQQPNTPPGPSSYFNSGTGTLSDANSTGGYAPVPNVPSTPPPSFMGTNLATAPGQGAAALYGINGQAPSNLFAKEGARAANTYSRLPLGIMNTGIDAMQVASHASDAREQALNNYINSVKAQLPQLSQTAINNLMGQWRASGNQALKVAAMGISARLSQDKLSQNDTRLTQSGVALQDKIRNTTSLINSREQLHTGWTPQKVAQQAYDLAVGNFTQHVGSSLGKPTTTYIWKTPPAPDLGTAVNELRARTGISQDEALQLLLSWQTERAQTFGGFSTSSDPNVKRYASYYQSWSPQQAEAPYQTVSGYGVR